MGKASKQEYNRLKKANRKRVISKRQALMEGIVYYECSRFAKHHHVFRWTARACGLVQYTYHRLTGSPMCG